MSQQMLGFGPYRFDRHSLTLFEDGEIVPLTSKAAHVLALLLDRAGEVVPKEDFLEAVWKDTFVEPRSLTQCIFLLRKAFGDQEGQAYIETVAKRGYRFAAPVGWVEAPGLEARERPAPLPASSEAGTANSRHRVHVLWVVFPLLAVGVLAVSWAIRSISQRPAQLGELKRLTWSGAACDPDVSLDGRFAVFSGEAPGGAGHAIYRIDIPGGFPRPITPIEREPVESPAISTDGRLVAFRSAAGDGQLMIVPADGSRPPQPVPDTSRARQPRWQPGHQALAYWVASEEHIRDFGGVYVKSIDPPGKPVRMFDGWDTAFAPLWATDGAALLALGTEQSSVPEREFDAWVNPYTDGSSTPRAVRTGLFELLRERGLYSTVRDRARITVTAWHEGYIYLSIHGGHAANLYRVAIGSDFLVHGVPQRLTSSAGLLLAPRMSANGTIVMTSSDLVQSPSRFTPEGGNLERLSAATGWLSRLSVADDGQNYAAEVYSAGSPVSVLFSSFAGGPSRFAAAGSVAFPLISPRGTQLAWRAMDGRRQAIDVAPAQGGQPKRICADCGAPEEWTSDESAILYHTGGLPARIGVVETATGVARDWIQHPDYSVFNPRLHSENGRTWVVFYAENTPRTRQVFLAEVSRWEAPPVSSWIPVTDGSDWDSSPAWSARGDSIYFVSLRDGHRCVYEQKLNARTHAPVGEPRAIRHLHSAAHPLAGYNRARGADSLRVAGAHIYLVLDSVTSDLWTARVTAQ
ncbi:MAG: winged helix-turn-helix domain-containing protein [Acidobacteria bacterium]|nr:winged helix-turn-helix domain-containing protein [Acidobacteriota bacterium]